MLDKALADAKIGPDLLKSLGDGMKGLADSAGKMAKLGDASIATNEYTSNVKTASKTITEMNLEANLNLTLSKVIEDGKELIPLFGPGFTGMDNLGNSCYMNSVV